MNEFQKLAKQPAVTSSSNVREVVWRALQELCGSVMTCTALPPRRMLVLRSCVEQEVADRVRAEERGNDDDGIRQDAGTLNENDFDERRASKGKRRN